MKRHTVNALNVTRDPMSNFPARRATATRSSLMKRTLICLVTSVMLASAAHAQETLRVFLAPEGVTGNTPLAGLSPTLANPTVDTSGGVQRLYLWAQADGPKQPVKWIGLGLNVVVTGSAQITNWNINNYANILHRWAAVGQGTLDGPAQRVTAINMVASPIGFFGVEDNAGPGNFDGQYDPATNSTILGWFEFTGDGEVFLEVGQMGIVRSEAPYPPAEGVNFGFGDEGDGLVGDDFNMASSQPDATLVGKDCPADLDDSGDVGVKDLLILLGVWGPCP